MKRARYKNGKLEYYIPSYNYMVLGKYGRVERSDKTQSKMIYYDLLPEDLKKVEEDKRYQFEIVDEANMVAKIIWKSSEKKKAC